MDSTTINALKENNKQSGSKKPNEELTITGNVNISQLEDMKKIFKKGPPKPATLTPKAPVKKEKIAVKKIVKGPS